MIDTVSKDPTGTHSGTTTNSILHYHLKETIKSFGLSRVFPLQILLIYTH